MGVSGTNIFLGYGGCDHIDGGDGNDFLYGYRGIDSIDGGNGVDECVGETVLSCEA
jgi:hypothetical protein